MMNQIESRLESLEARLARKERQLRRHQLVLVAGLLAAPAAVLLAAGDFMKFESIQVQRLEIVNESGQVMLAASSNAQGGQLDIWDAEQHNVIRLSANGQGGDMAIWNTEGNSVAGAWAGVNGGTVAVWDEAGTRAGRFAAAENAGILSLSAGTASDTVTLTSDEQGGRIHLRNPQGRDGFVAHVLEHGAAWALIDHNERETMVASTTGFGSNLHMARGDGSASLDFDASPGRDAIRFEADGGQFMTRLTEDDARGPVLTMSSPAGSIDLASGSPSLPPSIDLRNVQGQVAARTTLRTSGGGTCQVSNAQGKPVGILRSDLEGNGRLDLLDTAGHLLASLQTRQGTGATLALLSTFGKTVCALAGTNDGGILNLMNRTGVPVVSAGSAEDRRGGTLTVQNERGLPVVSIGSDAQESGQVRLQGPDGTTKQVLPSRR